MIARDVTPTLQCVHQFTIHALLLAGGAAVIIALEPRR
jgi:hypothetical protein